MGAAILTIGCMAGCLVLAWHRSAARLSPRARRRELTRAAALIAVVASPFGLSGSDLRLLGLALIVAAPVIPVHRHGCRALVVHPGLALPAQHLFISEKAVGKHSTSSFGKLGLAPSAGDNRRVLAVLAYLRS